jgi:hypothetical protein
MIIDSLWSSVLAAMGLMATNGYLSITFNGLMTIPLYGYTIQLSAMALVDTSR